MTTDYLERTSHHVDRDIGLEPEPPVSVSHFTHVLRRYRQVILLSLAAVVLTYAIIAVAAYLFSPAQHVTTQPFRLDFAGAGEGLYPNRTPFNIADIISSPTLFRVYRENHLADSIGFGEFSRSVFILESNKQYENLAAEYQTRLADPKLSPVDRERLQKEFELKRESIAKNEYAVAFTQPSRTRRVPDPIARKLLLDTLNDWADFEVNQQRVTSYQLSVLSREILKPNEIENEPLVGSLVLRAKANRVISDITALQKLPGATLVRTPADRVSLEEVRLRLEEIIRFQLEPLVSVIRSGGLVSDRAATLRFLDIQVLHDKRRLEATQRLAEATRQAMAVYAEPASAQATAGGTSERPASPAKGTVATGGEAVMPQLSDTFLDRLLTLTGRSSDLQYRQKLVDEYRAAVAATIPIQQDVAYDTEVINEMRSIEASGSKADAARVRAQLDGARAEVGQLIDKTNELFKIVNQNMTPSTQLFSFTGPPFSRTLRALSAQRLGLYGVLVFLIAIPVIIIFCLLHNRVREEEAAEEMLAREARTVNVP